MSAQRPRVAGCPDCASELVWTGPRSVYLRHDETCPSWRARTAAARAVVGPDAVVLLVREADQ